MRSYFVFAGAAVVIAAVGAHRAGAANVAEGKPVVLVSGESSITKPNHAPKRHYQRTVHSGVHGL
jgi:hypothetical protein